MASPRGSNMSLSNGAKFPSTHSLKSSGGQRSGSQSRLSQTQLAPSKESLHRQATSSGPALSADLLFKMSKKIAQLTKVIYFLNTQHEDRELQEKDMRRMHEEEILRMAEDTEKRLDVYKELLDKEHAERQAIIDTAVKEAQDQFDMTLKQEQQTHEQFKVDANKREKHLEQELSSLMSDVKDIRTQYAERVTAFYTKTAKAEEEYEALMSDLRAELEQKAEAISAEAQSREDTYKESIRQFQNLVEDANDEQNKLKKQLDDLMDKHRNELQEAETEIEHLRSSLQGSRRQSDTDKKEYDSQVKKMNDETIKIYADLQTLKMTNEFQAEEIDRLKDELQKNEDLLVKTTKKLLHAETEQRKSFEDLSEKEQSLDSLQQRQSDLEQKQQELQDNLKNTQQEFEKSKEELNQKENDMALLKTLLAKSERKTTQLSDENERLKTELTTTKEDVKVKEKTIFSLKVQLEESGKDAIKKIKAEGQRVQALSDETLKQKEKEYQLFIDNIKLEAAKTLQAQKEATLDAEADAKRNLQMVDDEALKTHECRLLIGNLEKKITGLESDLKKSLSKIKALQGELEITENDKTGLYQQIVEVGQKTTKELAAQFKQEAEKRDKEWSEKLASTVSANQTIFNEKMKNELSSLRNQLHIEHEKNILLIHTKNEEKTAKIQTDMVNMAAELENLTVTLTSKEIELKSLVHQHEAKINSLKVVHNDFIEKQRNAAEASRQALIEEMYQKMLDKCNELDKEWTQKLNGQKAAHQKEVDEMRNFHIMSNLAAKKEADHQRESDKNKLLLDFQEKVEVIKQEHFTELANLTLKSAQEKKQAMKEVEDQCMTVVQLRVQEIDDLKLTLDQKENEITRMETDIKMKVAQIASHEQTVTQYRNEIAHIKDIMRSSLEKLESELSVRHKRHIDMMKQTNLKECQKMLQEFDGAQAALKVVIAEKEKMLKMAEDRYKNRESREEDLLRIQTLEEEAKKRKRKMKILEEELEFIKLELLNREDNLNRMFNAKPQVGFIQPITQKQQILQANSLQRLPPLLNQMKSLSQPTLLAKSPTPYK